MKEDNHIHCIRRLFSEGFTQGKNFQVFREVVDPDVMLYDSAAPNFSGGLNAYIQFEEGYTRAFPDKIAKIDDIFSSGNRVVVRWTVTGTHQGDLSGIKATGNRIRLSGISVFTFSNGKVIEVHQTWDRLKLAEQLGQTNLATSRL